MHPHQNAAATQAGTQTTEGGVKPPLQSEEACGKGKGSWSEPGASNLDKGARLRRRPLHKQELDAEGAAAAAGALYVGVVELEAGTFERFDVVDFDAIEIHGTHLVDSDLHAV